MDPPRKELTSLLLLPLSPPLLLLTLPSFESSQLLQLRLQVPPQLLGLLDPGEEAVLDQLDDKLHLHVHVRVLFPSPSGPCHLHTLPPLPSLSSHTLHSAMPPNWQL